MGAKIIFVNDRKLTISFFWRNSLRPVSFDLERYLLKKIKLSKTYLVYISNKWQNMASETYELGRNHRISSTNFAGVAEGNIRREQSLAPLVKP